MIEAFPSCLIACHFLYYDPPEDKIDLNLTYLSILISLISTSFPPKFIKFIKEYLIYSILCCSIVTNNCILFGMISTISRPLSVIIYTFFPLFLSIIFSIIYIVKIRKSENKIFRIYIKKFLGFLVPHFIFGYPFDKVF
jgi:hypothetical protein